MSERENVHIMGVFLGSAATRTEINDGLILEVTDLTPPWEYANLALTGDVIFDFTDNSYTGTTPTGTDFSGAINVLLDTILESAGYDLWVSNQGGRPA